MSNNEHIHQTKIAVLAAITVILGLISVLSLFLVIRMKNSQINFTEAKPEVEEVVIEEEEEKTDLNEYSSELNLSKEVEELDKLNIQQIEDFYLEEKFDQ